MFTLDAVGSFDIHEPSGTYVYEIVPVSDGIAVISSDNNLRLIDPLSLHNQPLQVVQNVHADVTCLKALDPQSSIVCTAGRDGRVSIFDFRSRSKVSEVRTGRFSFLVSVIV